MEEYRIKKSTLTEIADSIRGRSGKTDPISGMDISSEITRLTSIETEEVTVDLAMANGDQVIEPTEGKALGKVTLTKPETLVPENIAEGVDIGGVIGSHSGGGGVQLSGDFLKYIVYQLDDENKQILVYGILWTKLYADTGSYDLNVPDTLGIYKVVLVSEGVV